MAKLHSTMVNSRGNVVSTINHTLAEVMAETWEVRITVRLTADGVYTITVSDRNTDKVIERVNGQYPEQAEEMFVQEVK